MTARRDEPKIERVDVSCYEIPTETPESDGTLEWSATTMVLVKLSAGGETGLGYTYAHAAAAQVVRDKLEPLVKGTSALDGRSQWVAMVRAIRNIGPHGLAAMAVAAVDVALWDLKAKLLGLPLVRLLGQAHDRVPGYGSGGFTSYTVPELERHMAAWVAQGYRRAKLKVGRHPAEDPRRVAAARRAVGPDVALYTDANGAYERKQALELAHRFHAESGVVWLEEPVSSEDLDGLALLRSEGPPGLAIAAGEYSYSAAQHLELLRRDAVDALQADATRCCGITGFLEAAALCRAFGVRLSAHCAPALHLHAALASPAMRDIECFFDHVRIERLLFDGAPAPDDHGTLAADPARPGLGLIFKQSDAARYER